MKTSIWKFGLEGPWFELHFPSAAGCCMHSSACIVHLHVPTSKYKNSALHHHLLMWQQVLLVFTFIIYSHKWPLLLSSLKAEGVMSIWLVYLGMLRHLLNHPNTFNILGIHPRKTSSVINWLLIIIIIIIINNPNTSLTLLHSPPKLHKTKGSTVTAATRGYLMPSNASAAGLQTWRFNKRKELLSRHLFG